MSHPGHVQFRFAVVPLVEQLVHLLLLGYPMESVLFVLPALAGLGDEGWMWQMKNGVFCHVLKELDHTFAGKVPGMEDTGFIKKLLLHIQVVAPVPCLQESGVVVKAGLDEASQCSYYDKEQEDGPAYCLEIRAGDTSC